MTSNRCKEAIFDNIYSFPICARARARKNLSEQVCVVRTEEQSVDDAMAHPYCSLFQPILLHGNPWQQPGKRQGRLLGERSTTNEAKTKCEMEHTLMGKET